MLRLPPPTFLSLSFFLPVFWSFGLLVFYRAWGLVFTRVGWVGICVVIMVGGGGGCLRKGCVGIGKYGREEGAWWKEALGAGFWTTLTLAISVFFFGAWDSCACELVVQFGTVVMYLVVTRFGVYLHNI